MAVRYQLWLKDQSGTRVALLDDLRRLQYRHRVNSPGNLTLSIYGNSDKVDLFETDGQVELYRSDIENGIAWYLEWEGLVITTTRQTSGNGDKVYTVYCGGYLDLLARRIVAYKAKSSGSDKSGTASTIMIEYARENAGDLATVANGRILAGTITGLSFGADPAAGGSWTGKRAYDNLLDVLQGIGVQANVDFDVVGVDAALFEFKVFDGQRGTDHTTSGLTSSSNGLNSSGNAPVVFALDYGNMATPVYSLARSGSANRVYALGQGEGAEREIVVRGDATDQAVSPFNLREVARQASNEETTAGLLAVADATLNKLRPSESFAFDVLQIPGTLYGKHYTWGDRVTARYDDIERDKRIIGVSISLDEIGRESISVDLTDYGDSVVSAATESANVVT